MFKTLTDRIQKAGVRKALLEGKLRCPDCGAKPGKLPNQWEDVLSCDWCSSAASLPEWIPNKGESDRRPNGDGPPLGTKIRKESVGPTSAVWNIPASGKFGFFLFFSIFWLLMTGLVSGGFLLAFLSGEEIEGNMPEWAIIPFFGIFWAVGLGTLYVAIRNKYMCYRLSVGGGEVTLRKEMFGRTKDRSLDLSSIKSVSKQVFYSQNYTPVYGIEIRGADGKLRFGTVLSDEEKAWLVSEVKEMTLGGSSSKANEPGGGSILEPIKLKQPKSVFSVAIPAPGKAVIIGPLLFVAMGVVFVCLGIFVIEGKPLPDSEQSQGAEYVFDLFFTLFTDGFRTVWILFSSVFAIIGISMSVWVIRRRNKDLRIEGNEAQISIRNYRRGLVLEDRSFARHEVSDIRASNSGHNNGKPMKRVELIVGGRAEKIASWMDGADADAIVEEVRSALGK